MNGRAEMDLNTFKKIESQLVEYPDFITSWYFYLKANNISAKSCNEYINKIRRFLEFINKDIESITTNDFNENVIVQYFINIKIKSDGSETSISYRQGEWSCLNNFFNFLYKRKLISDNYFVIADISRPKGSDLERINRDRILLTKDDFIKILDTIDSGAGSIKARGYQHRYKNRDKAIFLLFMTTGMRKSALEQINMNDIDFNNHTLMTIDKGHKIFTYHLSDEVMDVIDKWVRDRYVLLGDKNNEALFVSKENKRMHGNSIVKLVDKYSREALGYHISPHKLRSGFASILYEEKHDLEYVRRVIGHSNITTTQRYVVTNNNEREEAANLISNILT